MEGREEEVNEWEKSEKRKEWVNRVGRGEEQFQASHMNCSTPISRTYHVWVRQQEVWQKVWAWSG